MIEYHVRKDDTNIPTWAKYCSRFGGVEIYLSRKPRCGEEFFVCLASPFHLKDGGVRFEFDRNDVKRANDLMIHGLIKLIHRKVKK